MQPIGIIHSDHKDPARMPRQPLFAPGCRGLVELFTEYEAGLQDIEGFSHLHLIYYLHQAEPATLIARPFLDDQLRGVFATRSPRRPNHLGLSIVRLLRRDGNHLHLDEVDILDGTPLLDIKPFASAFDNRSDTRDGWLAHALQREAGAASAARPESQ